MGRVGKYVFLAKNHVIDLVMAKGKAMEAQCREMGLNNSFLSEHLRANGPVNTRCVESNVRKMAEYYGDDYERLISPTYEELTPANAERYRKFAAKQLRHKPSLADGTLKDAVEIPKQPSKPESMEQVNFDKELNEGGVAHNGGDVAHYENGVDEIMTATSISLEMKKELVIDYLCKKNGASK